MIHLPLTKQEARYLTDIIELWVEEYDSIVKDDIMLDETLEKAEDMLLAYHSAVEDVNSGRLIKDRILQLLEKENNVD